MNKSLSTAQMTLLNQIAGRHYISWNKELETNREVLIEKKLVRFDHISGWCLTIQGSRLIDLWKAVSTVV